jgi:glycosyltransferase involved in cell wall biosynthesis
VHHIPNGVNTLRYCGVDESDKRLIMKKLGLSCEKVFLTIGRVEDRKNYKFLLESWKYIIKTFPSSLLIIAGPGNTEDNQYYCELQNLIRQEHLQGVIFIGQRDDLDLYMKISDVFLFASKSEGFGTVLIEALVTGVPVVSKYIEGVTSDIIRQCDNHLAQISYSESPDDFAKIAINLLQNYDHEKRDITIVHFRETYSIDIIADRYLNLYHNMMSDV